MNLFDCFKDKLNRPVAAVLLMALLFLATIAPGFTLDLPAKTTSANTSLSAPSISYDFAAYPSQPKVDYSPNQSKSASSYAYTRKSPANNPLTFYQYYEIKNSWPRLQGSSAIFPESLHKDIKFFYLFADIPPPFPNI